MKNIVKLLFLCLWMLACFGLDAQSNMTRYIRLQQNLTGSTDYINLAELRAIQEGTEINVALNKTVVAPGGSTSGSSLVDGNTNNFVEAPPAGIGNFYEIDLGAAYELDRIEIVTRQDCCQNRNRDLQLILKDDAGTQIVSRPIDAYQNQNTGFQTNWLMEDLLAPAAALHFDGVNDYVEIPNNAAFAPTTTQAVTYEAWINPTSANDGIIAAMYLDGNSGASNFFIRRNANGTIVITGDGTNTMTSNAITPLNTWSHIAVVFKEHDGANQTKIYINGILDVTGDLNYLGSNSGRVLRLGIESTRPDKFKGSLDELRIWNKALTTAEIQSNMNCELTGVEDGLAAYYYFNHGFNLADNTGLNTLEDLTPNNNDGTLTNFALTGTSSNWVAPGGVASGTSCFMVSISGDTEGCDSLLLTATEGDSYLWSTGETTQAITVYSAGTYGVTVTNSGAMDSDETTVNILSANANISLDNQGCGETTLLASGGTSYLWSTGETTAQIRVTAAGGYAVTATDSNGCIDDATFTAAVLQTSTYYEDTDGDGYGNAQSVVEDCSQPLGYVSAAGDCDDNNADIHPGAPEICDDIDNNCNGILIEGACPGDMGEISPFCASASSDNVLNGEVFFNYGSVTNGLNTANRTSFSVGQPSVGTHFGTEQNGAFGFWSRFLLAPAAPSVKASNGDLPDRVEISWEPDPLSPDATGYKVYRNGSLLATLDGESYSMLDFNVIAGEFYTYEVAGFNQFGQGYKGNALGFLNPNGTVTGQVETFAGNPVPGAVVTLTPTIGTALSFDGRASSFLEYDTIFPRDKFTISCWVKVGEDNDKSSIFDFGSHIGKNWWLHTQPEGAAKGLTFGIGRDLGDVTELSYEFPAETADDWHYVAASYSGEALLFYVDGELIETATATLAADSTTLFLGQRPNGGGGYMGKLDDLRFFSRQLPQTEIQMLMNKSASSTTEGLVAYWKFDEGVGAKGFDISNNKFQIYHCGTAWTSDKPLVVNAGITDVTGFYKIEGINYSSGTTFTAIPSKSFYLNQSLEFNGVNETYADLTDFDLKDTAAVTVTMKAFDYSGNQAILSKADGAGTNQFELCLSEGNLDLILGGQRNSFGALEMGFHHIAVNLVQNGGSVDVELYKNGVLAGVHSYSGVATDWTGSPWKIGAKADGMGGQTDYFTGLIDEAVFFDSLLTLPEIQTYANIGTDVTNFFLSSRFALNEGTDNIIGDSGPALTGDGTIYGATWSTVTPIVETLPHEFNPSNRLVTLNPSNTGTDGVDFVDMSTVPVSGYIRFENTYCYQDSVEILVNGQSNFPPVFTDSDGRFSLDLEPGSNVKLTPKFSDHNFFPAFYELRNVISPVAGILFQNQTKREVTGQVAGGHCRLSVIPDGAIVKVKARAQNGCYEQTITLDNPAGNFRLKNLPPIPMTVSLVEHSDNTIYQYFNIQGGEQTDLRIPEDTTKYKTVIDFIYIAPPQVEIEEFATNECGLKIIEQSVPTNRYREYTNRLRVFEAYYGGECYLDTMNLTIQNDIADADEFTISVDSSYLDYTYYAGIPNLGEGHEKFLQVTCEVNGATATAIERAVVLGERSRESTFTTASPQRPIFILRDPPGDGSSASLAKGGTMCETWSDASMTNVTTGVGLNVDLGSKVTTYAGSPFGGVITEAEVVAELDISATASSGFSFANESEVCFTTEEVFTTSDGDDIVGADADLFVGAAINFEFGTTDVVAYDLETCSFVDSLNLRVFPSGFGTRFIYSAWQIKTDVIPSLEALGEYDDAQMWRDILEENAQLKRDALFKENLTFDALANYEKTVSSSTTSSKTFSWEFNVSAEMSTTLGFEILGAGSKAKVSFGVSTGGAFSRATNQTMERSVTYSLADDDPNDNFTLDIAEDPIYQTPVFRLKSGESMCPWEPGTLNREEVGFAIDRLTAVNVPERADAVFNIDLINQGQTGNDPMIYIVGVVEGTNPDGAIVSIGGEPLTEPRAYQLNPGETLNELVTINRGPIAYSYEDIGIFIASECQWNHSRGLGYDIRETVGYLDYDAFPELANAHEKFYKEFLLDVEFIEPCSPIEIGFPLQGWVITPEDNNTMVITINEFDVNDPDLELVRIQYRPTNGDGSWINITEIPKAELPPSLPFMTYSWDMTDLKDGAYEIRAISECFDVSLNPGISTVIKGRKATLPPELLGVPEPADGVLGPGDEISIQFTKLIQCDNIFPADGVGANINLNNVALIDTETGALIDATISCSEDKIIFVPNVPNTFLENKLLRAGVYNIEDLTGNAFVEEEWEFFVNRNPLNWVGGDIDESKIVGTELILTRKLENRGGLAQDYLLTNIPAWVQVFPTEGTLNPGESVDISFMFSEDLVNGSYTQTVIMDGVQGDEPMNINLRVICEGPDWDFDPSQYIYTMNFTLQLDIEGEMSEDRLDQVAAFVDGELRGVTNVQFEPSIPFNGDGTYFAFLTVYSNQLDGETLDFQIWDVSGCVLYGEVMEEFTFFADEFIGTPLEPQVIHTNNLVLSKIPIHAGWNWISYNLEMPDTEINAMLASLDHPQNGLIKGQTAFSQYFNGTNSWVGSLQNLSHETMYQYRSDAKDTLTLVGAPIDPATVDIPVVAGWNWIGYLPQRGQPLGTALASLTPLNGDIIKSQVAFAQYVAGIGWIGNLNFMSSPHGYLLKISNAGTLTYPDNFTGTPPLVANRGGSVSNIWEVFPQAYEHTMNMIAIIQGDENNLLEEDDEIGVFVGDEVRGSAKAMYLEELDAFMVFLTVYANEEGEELSFKFADASHDAIYDINESQFFAANDIVGSVDAPYPLTLATVSSTIELAEKASFTIYPNPAKEQVYLSFTTAQAERIVVRVTDALGREVERLETNTQAGRNILEWMPKDLTEGMYFISLDKEAGTETRKVRLK